MLTTTELLAPFETAVAMRLETRKRDGTVVATVVNVAVDAGRAYFRTFERSGKAKRLRNFSDVTIAPCTWRGRVTGSALTGHATLLRGDRDKYAARLVEAKHPFLQGVFVPLAHRLQRQRTQHYEIVVDDRIGHGEVRP